MNPDEILFETEDAMQHSVDYLLGEMSAVRTGKASPALVENISIKVESYGSNMPLKNIALISTPEPRLIVVQPHDPSVMADVERGLKESKLGITPNVQGKLIRLPIPELSEERRVEYVKLVKDMAEQGRVRIRAARKDGNDKLKTAFKDKSITEDAFHDHESTVQDLTNKYVKSIDEHLDHKEKEIMTV
ncbi:ribosome recycling factor [Verrucomicrobiales bacterium]|nr:ribosome recycling factor [bacterium]MDA7672904.1 ribosome recycling factor [Verrucomicrobiales bacterium]MDC0275605.1 ribosome recycling factor [Verrucomicrobiales bacterium]MDC0291899.1 ribosome recycling factor [Verrucomicrobiales bacterium]MDC0322747.1 ribosome recycling factor [Verrucomicrobiales bacterium]